MFTSFLLSPLTGHQHLQSICVGILPSAKRVHVTVRAAEDCCDILHRFISVRPFQLIFAEKTKHSFPLVDYINLFSEKIDHDLLTSWNLNRYCCRISHLFWIKKGFFIEAERFVKIFKLCVCSIKTMKLYYKVSCIHSENFRIPEFEYFRTLTQKFYF